MNVVKPGIGRHSIPSLYAELQYYTIYNAKCWRNAVGDAEHHRDVVLFIGDNIGRCKGKIRVGVRVAHPEIWRCEVAHDLHLNFFPVALQKAATMLGLPSGHKPPAPCAVRLSVGVISGVWSCELIPRHGEGAGAFRVSSHCRQNWDIPQLMYCKPCPYMASWQPNRVDH